MIYTDPKRIILFDTTLRDGEQALPQSLSAREKMQIALALEQLGGDVIPLPSGQAQSRDRGLEAIQEGLRRGDPPELRPGD